MNCKKNTLISITKLIKSIFGENNIVLMYFLFDEMCSSQICNLNIMCSMV